MPTQTRKHYRMGHIAAPAFPRWTEYALLAVFLVSRIWLFIAHYGEAVGWDVDVHLQMIRSWPLDAARWDIASAFYAYHPPLSFIPPYLFIQAGMGEVAATQLMSALCSIIGFFFLRALLSHLQVLRTWKGIVFLYVTSALPMQIYLARSINMDVMVYAETCAVLYFSACMIFPRDGTMRIRHAAGLLVALAAALFTKYSGILLLAVPPLFAFFAEPRWNGRAVRRIGSMLLICAAVIALASPYYYIRYYKAHGMWFPTNMNLEQFDQDALNNDLAHRDQNHAVFWKNFLWGTSRDSLRMQDRDQDTVRILNTWKDLWSGNKWNIAQSPASLALSKIEATIASFLCLLGAITLLYRRFPRTPMDAVGYTMIILALLELALLILYSYRYPHPNGVPNKGAYVAPAMLGFGWLLSETLRHGDEGKITRKRRIVAIFAAILLGTRTALGALLTVY